MLKTITLTVFVLLSAPTVFSQAPQPCDLKLSQAPTLRGLRLGMSVAAVSEILGVPINPQPVQTRVSFIRSSDDYVRQDSRPTDQTGFIVWYRN